MAVAILGTLFALYVVLTAWQARRAVRTTEPQARLTEARRLLGVVSLGVPLAVAVILILL
jgi:membrane protein implicated in regulation of membrane protease activity